jgi:hypothetical protein
VLERKVLQKLLENEELHLFLQNDNGYLYSITDDQYQRFAKGELNSYACEFFIGAKVDNFDFGSQRDTLPPLDEKCYRVRV